MGFTGFNVVRESPKHMFDFHIPLEVKGKITLHVLKRLFYCLYIGISAIKISRK